MCGTTAWNESLYRVRGRVAIETVEQAQRDTDTDTVNDTAVAPLIEAHTEA